MTEAEDLMDGYTGDEPYPDDDHSLGLHEDDPDPDCRECRPWRSRVRAMLREEED